jgi:hypothetical protein
MGAGAGLLALTVGGAYMFWISSRAADVGPTDRALASRYNQAEFDVLGELVTRPDSASERPPDENILLSPISLGTALHMIEEGARGPTATELREALHLPDEPSVSISRGPSQILQRLRHPEPEYALQRLLGRGSVVDTRLANAGWFDASPTETMKTAGLLDFEIRKKYRRVL